MFTFIEELPPSIPSFDGFLTTKQAAERMGVVYPYACRLLVEYEVAPVLKVALQNYYTAQQIDDLTAARTQARRGPALERRKRLAKEYKSGATLEEIAAHEGVTRERIRQLISKEGVTGKDGGGRVTAARWRALNAMKHQAARDANALKRSGCTYAERQQLRTDYPELFSGVAYRYRALLRNAGRINTPFTISLIQYAALIIPHIDKIGRGTGKLNVCPIDRKLGYIPGNVELRSVEDNGARKTWNPSGPIEILPSMTIAMRNIVELRNSGMSNPAIAKKLRTTSPYVASVISTARRAGALHHANGKPA